MHVSDCELGKWSGLGQTILKELAKGSAQFVMVDVCIGRTNVAISASDVLWRASVCHAEKQMQPLTRSLPASHDSFANNFQIENAHRLCSCSGTRAKVQSLPLRYACTAGAGIVRAVPVLQLITHGARFQTELMNFEPRVASGGGELEVAEG